MEVMWSEPIVVTPPSGLAVDLADVRANLVIDGSEEDAYLASLAAAAHDYLSGPQGRLGRTVLTTVYDLKLGRFPARGGPLHLPVPPLREGVSIRYFRGPDGAETLVDPNDYEADYAPHAGIVVMRRKGGWPDDVNGDLTAPVIVRYSAGYGSSPGEIPRALRQAMILLVSHWYENRVAVERCQMHGAPLSFDALIRPYIIMQRARHAV